MHTTDQIAEALLDAAIQDVDRPAVFIADSEQQARRIVAVIQSKELSEIVTLYQCPNAVASRKLEPRIIHIVQVVSCQRLKVNITGEFDALPREEVGRVGGNDEIRSRCLG